MTVERIAAVGGALADEPVQSFDEYVAYGGGQVSITRGRKVPPRSSRRSQAQVSADGMPEPYRLL
jgi:hypothetical protein